MVKRAPNYALVLVLILVTALVAYRLREKPMPVLLNSQLASFPLSLPNWVGQDVGIPAEVRSLLNADDVLSRNYASAETGEAAGLLVVYRKYGRRDFIHRPELCYPSQGWKIVESGRTRMPYNGNEVQATKVVAEKDGAREIIVYWFASGSRTESNYLKQQYLMALDRFQTQKYGWAFVRINCAVMYSDAETIKTMRDLAASASQPLVSILTGSPCAACPAK